MRVRHILKAALLVAALAPCALARAGAANDALVQRGAYLAKLGDCAACHTAPRGKAYAGGLPLSTPFGTLYSTNISPDPGTGIGRWSLREFDGALRRGVARDGHNLYPAMPYPSYAKLRDDDVAALYGYFMKGVEPAAQANREAELRFPFNMRWTLALWNFAFLDAKPYQDKIGQDAQWNRGAYLTQGLGHCGACHTPRGVGFQEKGLDERSAAFLSGTQIDGWFASNLRGERRAGLGRWSPSEVMAFLRTGSNRHAMAFGSMTDVINKSTQYLQENDLVAMARYLKSLAPQERDPTPDYVYPEHSAPAMRATQAALERPATDRGGRAYRQYCLQCHGADGRGRGTLLAPLAGNPNVLTHDAASLINVTLNGARPLVIQGLPSPYPMPAFGATMNDREIADVLTFIRGAWSNGAGAVRAKDVAQQRHVARAVQ